MEKNTAGKWVVFAYGLPDHANAGQPITGDAANITANMRIDGGAANAIDDTNPTELEDGYYIFDITAAEANGDNLLLTPASGTANVQVIAVPGAVWTRPANFNDLSVTSSTGRVDVAAVGGTTQTANDIGADVDDILVDTNELQGDWTNTGRLDTILDNILADTGGTLPATLATILQDTGTTLDNHLTDIKGTGFTKDVHSLIDIENDVGNLTSGTAAINTTAESFTKSSTEPETATYTATHQYDGTVHLVEDVAGTTDCYYQFDVGGNGVPVSITWSGYANLNGDSYAIYAYNYGGTAYEQIGTINGASGSTITTETFNLTVNHVGTGANLGKVRFRFYSTDGTGFATDSLLCSYAVVAQSVGYSNGAVWINTNASNTNTESYVDGVADNPVSTIAAANTIASNVGLKQFYVNPGSSITLAASQINETFSGEGWTLALGGQDISSSHFYEAIVSGVGTTGSGNPDFHTSAIGTATIGPADYHHCHFSATLTAGTAGDYFLYSCASAVAGAGSPTFDFNTNIAATTNLNVRNWSGGGTWTLNSNVTMSLEVSQGGTQTINAGGGDVEFRGLTKKLAIVLTGGETINIIGFVGDIAISGAGVGSTINVYGQNSGITNTATGSPTVNDYCIDTRDWNDGERLDLILDELTTNIDAIETDTQDLQTQIGTAGAGLTDLGGMSTAMKAEVNTELLDVIETDTFAELAGVPAATSSLKDKLTWVFMLARNQIEQTATTTTVRADDTTTSVATSTVSDNGTTATRGEMT